MALIFSPDPMPLEVISALGLLAGEVDALPVGDTVELIALRSSSPGRSIYRQYSTGLKQEPYQGNRRPQTRLSTRTPETPTLRANAGNSLARNSPTTTPVAGLICWMSLEPDAGSTRN